MKKSLLMVPVIAAFTLTGCVQDVIGEAVGKVVGAMVQGMDVCSVQSIQAVLTNGIDLEIPKADIENIFSQIRTGKIETADQFWSGLDPDTAVVLNQMVQDQFNIEIRNANLVLRDYLDAIAAGLINAASKGVKSSYSFYKEIRTDVNGISVLDHAKVNLMVTGTDSNEKYVFGICDPGSSN